MAAAAEAIDVHCHVISPDRDTYPLAPLGGKQSDWSAERTLTPEQLIAAMDKAGVAKAAVVQASTAYGHNSSYVADSIARFPERMAGVFSIDPLDPDAVKHIEHWTSRGLTGMRVFTTGTTMPGQQGWLGDEAGYRVWEEAGRRKLPVAMQMTLKGVPMLEEIARAFPQTDFLLDHLARITLDDGPPYAAGAPLLTLAKYPNVYLKLTSRTVEQCHKGKADAKSFMEMVLKHFGAKRMLWGSNFPAHDDTLANILRDAMGVIAHASAGEQAEILSGTAKRLYPSLA
ncbi:MAG: amidohydrolase [Hyphomicrobiales bacterium]|nr:amidohydrolase [Hyphomicrobiales bacterium]